MARRNLEDTINDAMNEEVDIDFSGARDGDDFQALPPGDYEAEVESVTPGTSGGGNPKLTFRFKITDDRAAGRVVFKHCPTTGEGAGITRSVLKGLGFDLTGTKAKFKPSDAVGVDCVLTLAIQKDNPEFNEVKRVKQLAKAGITGRATAKAGTATKATGARKRLS